MRVAHLLICLSAAIVASALTLGTRSVPSGFNAAGHYNAPHPPWESGAKPGWYFGSHAGQYPDLFGLTPVGIKQLIPFFKR